ncbi:MAG: TaqI-like C-terminal specificity domain-containing protein [Candidatus Nitrosocosmicus sp.]
MNFEGKGIKLLTGKEISRYGFNSNIEQWYLEEKYVNETDRNRARVPKIVVQDIVAHITKPNPHIKITAAIDTEKRLCLNTVMCFAENENSCKNEFLLSLFCV